MGHTKTPWFASKRGDAIIVNEPTADHGNSNAKEVEHYGGYVVAESLGTADREFVLRACNAHEQLVAALREAIEIIQAIDQANNTCERRIDVSEFRAALTAAGAA